MNAFMLIVNIVVMSLATAFLLWFFNIVLHCFRTDWEYGSKEEKISSLVWLIVVAIITLAALACTIYDFVLLVS